MMVVRREMLETFKGSLYPPKVHAIVFCTAHFPALSLSQLQPHWGVERYFYVLLSLWEHLGNADPMEKLAPIHVCTQLMQP